MDLKKNIESLIRRDAAFDLFVALSEQSPNMIFVNVKGQLIYVNKQCETLTGYAKEEFLSPEFDFFRLIAPESLALIKENFARHLNGEELPPYEYIVVKKNGERIEVINSTKLIELDGQKAILGVVTEISEQKKLERALCDSRALYQKIIDLAPITIAIHSEGKLVFINPAGLRLLRIDDPDEVIGKPIVRFVHPDSQELIKKRIGEMMRTGIPQPPAEEKFVRRDGTVINVETTAVPINYQGKPAVQVIVKDVTEVKKLETRMRLHNAITGTLVETKTLKDAAPKILSSVCDALRWEFGSLWQLDRTENRLRPVQTWHLPGAPFPEFETRTQEMTLALDEGVPGRVVAGHVPVWITDLNEEKNCRRTVGAAAAGFRSAFFFPILAGTGAVGVIEFFSRATQEPDQALIEMFRSIGGQIGLFVVRQEAEEELKLSEHDYANLIEKSNDGFVILQDDLVRFSNPKLSEITGVPRNEIIGKNFIDFIVPENRAMVVDRYKQRLQGGSPPSRYEICLLIKKAPGKLYVEINSAVIDYKGKPAVMAIIRDMSERKQVEEALRKAEQDLTRAQAVGKIGSWRLRVRLNKFEWSDETYRIFSVPTGTPMTYESFLSFVCPDDRERVDKAWQAALGGELFDIEHRILVNGSVKWVREQAELEFDENKNLLGGFGTVQDITEVKQAELAMLELDRLKSDFISTVSHELRTPLSIIKEGVSLVLEGVSDHVSKDDQVRFLESVLNNVDRLTLIINDLLDISAIESGKVQLNKVPMDICASVLKVVDEFRLQTEKKGLEMKCLCPLAAGQIMADPEKIDQIIMNLISNAVKFTRPGGLIEVKMTDKDGRIEVNVADNGVGIAPENLPKLFSRFSQFGRVAGQGPKGTGLGLAITKNLVEMHGGKIRVESSPGNGSNFIVSFPKYIKKEG